MQNHFIVSLKEFLTNASKEKAFTYQDTEDLVHFVDSQQALSENTTLFGNLKSAPSSSLSIRSQS